jgi:hypothetical protein
MPGGELDIGSRPPRIGIWPGGEPAMLPAWGVAKKGRLLVQSLVYWAAVFVVEPRAERRGDVMG